MKINYKWKLKETKFTKDKWSVFSCFACWGGSTMWYKLAWFDVIWCNEIDPKMNACYVENHNPKYNYLEDIRTFKLRDDLPKELYNLDILDWSPPCSSFSLAWNREKDWWKEKKFKEWQSKQVLDTLFFDFIDLTKKLKPKIAIAENVKWILLWEAQEYMNKILIAFDEAWYNVNYKLLDASKMWVPQRRERVFFYAIRKDLLKKIETCDLFWQIPYLDLNFNNKQINFWEIQQIDNNRKPLIDSYLKYWNETNEYWKYDDRKNWWICFWFFRKAVKNIPLCTIMWWNTLSIEESPHLLNKTELCLCWSYPIDYNFLDNDHQYLIWMSVPPLMTYWIANNIYNQWIKKLW